MSYVRYLKIYFEQNVQERERMRTNQKPTPNKYCKYCGKKLERIRFPSGRLECLNSFDRRKYCDRECMKKGFLKLDSDKQSDRNGRATAQRINELILHKDKCEICGSKKNIDVHHKDENPSNNVLDNLMVLCRSCHMKIHHPKPKCKVCGKPVKGYGFCEKHYQRFRKYGDPLLTNRGHGHIVKVSD